ncbi:hypothetical protein CASFOL_016264 [Castilleja foliolosa]|uniref:F-box domain-containing protein n=1 Tax=Castilleja foliolosa TaxID=1961234 RepID=A0ABD3DI34_9LAMI
MSIIPSLLINFPSLFACLALLIIKIISWIKMKTFTGGSIEPKGLKPIDNNNMIDNVVAPPLGRSSFVYVVKLSLVATILTCCIVVMIAYSFRIISLSPSPSPTPTPSPNAPEEEKPMLFFILRMNSSISSKTKSNRKDKDLISKLSDDLLISIINRLPTKEVVRTSILSNRWRTIYKFTPDVDLDSKCLVGTSPCSAISFVTALERFLSLRSGCNIRCLSLFCCFIDTPYNQHDLIMFSLVRLLLGIQGLALHSLAGFNKFLFSCHLISEIPSLAYLSLGYFVLCRRPYCDITQSNSLQVLRLIGVTLLPGALECILDNCLSLHTLSLDICKIFSKLIIRGPNLKLKSLCVRGCRCLEKIKLYASNLTTFEFESLDKVIIRFDHVPKLESVYLHFENKHTVLDVCKKLVRDLPSMKSLIFGTKENLYQVIISEVICFRSMGINTFINLRQLSLHIYSTIVYLPLFVPFLEGCPLLQEFHLDAELVEYDDWKHLRRPPAVFQELKKVEFTGHTGTKPEIELALNILKSAINLEQMQISRCSKRYNGRGSWSGRDEPPWSKQTSEMIHEKLRGQAKSPKARLTIQHSLVSLKPPFSF